MIYLFEDRKGRMSHYLDKDLNSKSLKESIFDYSGDISLSKYINNEYGDAKCILFHSSYTIPSKNITKENIKAEFAEMGVPFVLFSGGMGNNYTIPSNNIIQGNINSGTMYENLKLFIDDFEKSNIINVPLLIFGSNFLMNELLKSQNLITMYLSAKKTNYILSSDDKQFLTILIEATLKNESLSTDVQKLILWLSTSEKSITIITIKQQIQRLIYNYQK